MLKKATWYNHQGMSPLRLYSWYYLEFSGKTFKEIISYQVEPGTIGELAQANVLGVSIRELQSLKVMA